MDNPFLLGLTALLTGAASGMGIGGGTLLVIILSSFMGYEQKSAQGINLVGFLACAPISVVIHAKNRLIKFKTALLVCAGGIISAVVFAIIASGIESGFIKKAFGALVLAGGVIELFCRDKTEE